MLKKFSYKPTLKHALLTFAVNIILFSVAFSLTNSVAADSIAVIAATIVSMSIINWAAGPLFELFAKTFGVLGVLVIGLFGNAIIVWVAIQIVPGISISSFWTGFVFSWFYATLATVIEWALLSRSNDMLLSEAIRHAKIPDTIIDPDTSGFVFVQLDGVSHPLLEWEIKAGNLPNINRLLQEKDYALEEWSTGLPSTTPASQAGILLGRNDIIPAFRWYEKKRKAYVVANQFDGAKEIEKRLSTREGLLSEDGVSIGNLFSGGAKQNIMVMSKIGSEGRSLRSLRNYSSYFYTPYGFMRSLILSIGEMVKELYQARRQKTLDVQPRVHRGFGYMTLRALTNVLMRDLQTTMVIDHMMRGTKRIYVDYLDYDEVAHHAGYARPESLASLYGLDQIVGVLYEASTQAERSYNLVFVSDHGQSQGQTFKQLRHETLDTVVARLAGISQEKHTEEIAFTGSGNLGNVWFKKIKGRATKEVLDKAYPNLIQTLCREKGIGLVMLQTDAGPIVFGKNGSLLLKTEQVQGLNPLRSYSDISMNDLLVLAEIETAPDITIISEYNPVTGEVHAFEELVGNHGGAGGWQTKAMLLYPKSLQVPKRLRKDGQLHGPVALHDTFMQWMNEK